MTNQIAIALVFVIIAVFAVDYVWFDFDLPILIGKKFTELVSYLIFWD